MSGKIGTNSGYVTKVDFARLQSKVDAIISKLSESPPAPRPSQNSIPSAPQPANRKLGGGVKSWLYSKAGSRAPSPQRPSSDGTNACQNCGAVDYACAPRHEHIFQKRGNDEGLGRNDNQRCLKNEFNQFQADVTRDIRSLQKSVIEVQALCESLEKLVHQSLANIQANIDKLNAQLLVKTARLEQQGVQSKQRVIDSEVLNSYHNEGRFKSS